MSRRERGHLEAEVMQLLWANPGGLTSAQLESAFMDRRRPARTTLLTVLSRLEDKDLVERTSAPGGAVFRATQAPVSYTHLTLPTIALLCRSRWSPYH